MSAIKTFAVECDQLLDDADNALYSSFSSLASLSHRAWVDDCTPVWAPSAEWIAETQTQLRDMLALMGELQAAQEALGGEHG